VFRRNKSESPDSSAADQAAGTGGKGRPTPSRKEAEAAARARAKAPRSRRELAAAQKAQRSQGTTKMREAMRTGEDRFLPARDQGPVKRFIRDLVDSRFSMVELMIPVLLITTVLAWSGNTTLAQYGNALLLAMLVIVIVDTLRLRSRLKKGLAARFPETPTKGLTYYAVMRSLQMRFMRLPKAQVKIGQALPERYR
jgi:hypothetical protein